MARPLYQLLPPEERDELVTGYRLRLCSVMLVLVLFVLLCANLSLLAPFFFIETKEREAEDTLASLQQQETADQPASTSSPLVLAKSYLSLLAPKHSRTAADAVEQLVAMRPNDISLTGFLYQSSPGGSGSLQVSGLAASREGLVRFGNLLQQSGAFATVDLPLSGLAKDRQVDFSITVTGPF